MSARWLKSPDVRYTQPLGAAGSVDSIGTEDAAASSECAYQGIVDGLRARVAELERKLRELEPDSGI